MSVSAMLGPLVIYGDRNPQGTGATGTTNPDRGPSMFWGGTAILDPRGGYNKTKAGAIGFVGNSAQVMVLDVVPSTISAVNIAASQSPAAGAITLVSVTGAGINVLATPLLVLPSMNTVPVNALCLDALPTPLSFGRTSGSSSGWTMVSAYDPGKVVSRNVRLTSGGNDSGITFTVAGYDAFGYPMTEAITGANAGVASGKKGFKFITGVTHTGSVAGTLTIGTGDVYSFPIKADLFPYVQIFWNNALITATTGFVVPDATSPATTTTGDVRGTYAVQSASDGTKRLTVFVSIPPGIIAAANPVTALFGIAQV